MVLRLLEDGYIAEEIELAYNKRVSISDIKELIKKYSLPISRGMRLELDAKDIIYYDYQWQYRGMRLELPVVDGSDCFRPSPKLFRQYGRLFECSYFHDGEAYSVRLIEE
ncbi:MAG: hypothetical protein RR319_01210 [Bacteroides sp.]